LGLLAVALLKRLCCAREILRDLRVALLELLGLLGQILSRLLALLGRHLVQLLGQLIELLGGLLQAWALARLLSREPLEVTRHLLKRGAARVGVWVNPLL
jgi:hypothetical protein